MQIVIWLAVLALAMTDGAKTAASDAFPTEAACKAFAAEVEAKYKAHPEVLAGGVRCVELVVTEVPRKPSPKTRPQPSTVAPPATRDAGVGIDGKMYL